MRETYKAEAVTEQENALMADIETVKNIVAGVRAVRNQKNIAPKEALTLQVVENYPWEAYNAMLQKMANLEAVNVVAAKADGAASFMVGTTEFAVPLNNLIDVESEIAKAEAELKHLRGFLVGVEKKLSNEKFVSNAPAAVVEMEKKKQADALSKIATLEESLAKLKK
jgi:valyl-tRNA synthetase